MAIEFDFDSIRNRTTTANVQGRTTGSIFSCNAVIDRVQSSKNIVRTEGTNTVPDRNTTMALISGLCQVGGTNRNASGNVQFTFGDKTLSAVEFQRICQEAGTGTSRQFARALANDIQRFAEILDLEGDLARQMQLDVPSMTKTMKIWCSNFQSENQSCPAEVREWLKEDRKRRFRN